ncbi:MAG: reverse transcriptase N-terminal domain-containing protein [Arsenophonus sp. NEOnobi-MAG3]
MRTSITKNVAASLVSFEPIGQNSMKKVLQKTKNLQTSIIKATKEGRWNKVKSLQRLFTHLFSGKRFLVTKQVTENRSKRTAGIDKKIWFTPGSKYPSIKMLTSYGSS